MPNDTFSLPRVLRWAALAAAVAIGLAALVGAVRPDYATAVGGLHVNVETSVPAGAAWWLRAFATVLPAAAFVFAMVQLATLLDLIARGEVFSPPAARYLRRFGVWLLVATLAGVVCPFLAQLVHNLTHGISKLELALSSRDVWNVFLSALFMLVARVLSDAYRLAEENRQII
jgi:cell division protein FtsW (lipid II flippase)